MRIPALKSARRLMALALALVLLLNTATLNSALAQSTFTPTEEDLNLIYGGNEFAPLGDGFDTCTANRPGTNSGVVVEGGEVETQIWTFLLAQGFTEAQAAGIMGNLHWESGGLNPGAINSIGATGLAQWLGSRLTNLHQYATARDTEATDLLTQLEFLMFELTGDAPIDVSNISGGGSNRAAYDDLITRTLVDEATAAWAMLFERYTEANRYRRDTAAALGVSVNAADPHDQIPPPPGFEDDFIFAFNTRPTNGEGTGGGIRIDLARAIFENNTGTFAPQLSCTGANGNGGEIVIGETFNSTSCGPFEDVSDQRDYGGDDGMGADGYADNHLYKIRVCNVRGIHVNAQIAEALDAMIAAMLTDPNITSVGGGGFRSRSSQIALRRAHCGTSDYDVYRKPSRECRPPTATPGNSNHQMGLAIDFVCNGQSHAIRAGSPCFTWLSANAERYGLYNLPSESWHWSVNGR